MGSDNIFDLPKWKSSEDILNNYQLLVYKRPGYKEPPSIHPNIFIIESELLDISASSIRSLIKNEKSIKYIVPEPARLIIEKSGYYK